MPDLPSLPGFPRGLPSELTGPLSGFNPISCGFNETPVIVVATYKGKIVPIPGATVTTFYSAVLARGRQLVGSSAYETAYTNELGVAQTCMVTTAFVEARIQKSGINFGSGIGVQHSIGSVSGTTRGLGPYVFYIDAQTPPPLPPCFGSIDLPNAYEVIGAFSAPPTSLSPTGIGIPSIPRLTVNAVINNASKSIPIAVIVDGKQVATAQSSNGIDILSILRSLGPDALKKSHTLSIESRLTDCNIPAPPPINIPALTLPSPCTPPAIFNPVTGRCETPCTPPAIFNPVTGRCETPCTPPAIFNPVTGRCETPCTPPAILNPVTGKCETPQGLAPLPSIELGKVVKILSYPEGASLQAFDGMDVTITASVLCGATLSDGEAAILFVDGNETARGTTSNGTVSFTWKATAQPSRTHKICVSIPKSSQCGNYGEARDCKTITVSRQVPEIGAQLEKERQAYLGQLEALRQEREKIRQISIEHPTVPTPPGLISPLYPTPPNLSNAPTLAAPTITYPTTPGVTVPSTPEQPVNGIIDIPAVPFPPGVQFPVMIYVDGTLVGGPPINKEVTPGTHTIRIQLKGFPPISKKVNISPGQVLTLQESFL